MRKRLVSGLWGILAVIAAGAPLRGGMTGTPAIDPAIEKVQEAYRSSVVAGDAPAVAAVFADDAVEMPPFSPPLRGREAIERYYRERFSNGMTFSSFSLTPIDVRVTGDLAYIVGTSRQTIAVAPGSTSIESSGKYVVILRRERGTWKVADAIYNTDQPPGRSR